MKEEHHERKRKKKKKKVEGKKENGVRYRCEHGLGTET